MKSNKFSATVVLALAIGASALVGFGQQRAYATDECAALTERAADIDVRNKLMMSTITSKYAMLNSARENKEDKLFFAIYSDIKLYEISYLGLIIEQRAFVKGVLESTIADRCNVDKADLKTLFYESFSLEEEYKKRIADITKTLDGGQTESSTTYNDL
jgi:hypothetical protein